MVKFRPQSMAGRAGKIGTVKLAISLVADSKNLVNSKPHKAISAQPKVARLIRNGLCCIYSTYCYIGYIFCMVFSSFFAATNRSKKVFKNCLLPTNN